MRQLRHDIQGKRIKKLQTPTGTNKELHIGTSVTNKADFNGTPERDENIGGVEKNKTREKMSNMAEQIDQIVKLMQDTKMSEMNKRRTMKNWHTTLPLSTQILHNEYQSYNQSEHIRIPSSTRYDESMVENIPEKECLTLQEMKQKRKNRQKKLKAMLDEMHKTRQFSEEIPTKDETSELLSLNENGKVFNNALKSHNKPLQAQFDEQITHDQRLGYTEDMNQHIHADANDVLDELPEKLETNKKQSTNELFADSITTNPLMDSESFENIVGQLNKYISNQIDSLQ